MDDTQILESLTRFTRFYRRQRTLLAVGRASLWGALLSLLAALGAKGCGIEWPETAITLAPALLVPGGVALAWWLRPIPTMDVARAVDRIGGLHERAATALEWIGGRRPQTLMARAQLRDASAALRGMSPKAAFPLTWPRRWWLTPLVLLGCVGLYALPEWNLFPDTLDRAERDALRAQLAQISTRAEELKPASVPPPLAPQLARLQSELKALSRDLQGGRVKRREALARVAAAREQARQALEASRGMARRNPGPGQSGAQSDQREQAGNESPRAAAARLRAMAERLRKKPGPTDKQREEMRRALDRMAKAADNPEAARKAMESAARQMKSFADMAAAQQLEQAAQAMAGADSQTAKTLEQIMGNLDSAQAGMAGQPQMAQQSGPGAGQVQEMGEGQQMPGGAAGKYTKRQGKAPADYGKGSTNREQKGAEGKRPDYVLARQSSRSNGMRGEYQKLYLPERHKMSTGNAKVRGNTQAGPVLATADEARGAPRMGDTAATAEGEVYMQYRREAEEAMLRERVPQEYRDLIRSYFQEIDPRAGGN